MIILHLPHLSTQVKLRKHKSNKLAVLVGSDAQLHYRRRAIFLCVCVGFFFLPRIHTFRHSWENQFFSKHLRFQKAVFILLFPHVTGCNSSQGCFLKLICHRCGFYGNKSNITCNLCRLADYMLVRNISIQLSRLSQEHVWARLAYWLTVHQFGGCRRH